jgi:hypothetical protein
MVQDIDNEVGSASMPESQERISEEESTELCELLLKLKNPMPVTVAGNCLGLRWTQ